VALQKGGNDGHWLTNVDKAFLGITRKDIGSLGGLPLMSDLLTKNEVAAILKKSVRSVDRLRSSGDLRAFHVGGSVRFTQQALTSFLEKQQGRKYR
jgi:excisionase family DNA binding protein